ncbi:uncharacterized protein LOC124313429 [Daphnia pulicaria]|uniref:uncharacterized protein LOC124313429 n=1 Tax=Daphnia pulicaria TaxID=35523 RepID=UPI001EEC7784|nr:uncharacterized protein LOC124313429 [Daphnia pulicaria]
MNFKLSQCCCGFSLRAGTIIIGIVVMFAAITGFIEAAISISGLSIDDGDHMRFYFYMGQMIGSGFTIFATVPVLIAAWKNRKPNLLSPWLVIKFLSLVTAVIYWFYLGILAILANAVYYGTSFILGACIGGAICSYYWLVVYSYYHELNKADMKTRPEEKNAMRYHKC